MTGCPDDHGGLARSHGSTLDGHHADVDRYDVWRRAGNGPRARGRVVRSRCRPAAQPARATVTLDGIETVECTFSDTHGELPSTGSNATQTLLVAAALALLAGLVLCGATRRRRHA